MSNTLDTLPSALLSHLDAALPLLTQSAIRGEFLQGVSMLCAGLFINVGFLLLCWYVARREEYMVCLAAALFGFGMVAPH